MRPLQVEVPQGRVRLAETHTFVAGGLSSLLTERKVLPVVDAASRVCGSFLFAASRLLLLYAVTTLSKGENFPVTGLANENETAPVGLPAPVVFTQELCDWALCTFKRGAKKTAREEHPAFIGLKALAAPLIAELGLLDGGNLGRAMQSLAKSLSVVISNHLTVACVSHTAIYLRAKYAAMHLGKKEANQLAKTIGRSVQWNALRTSKQPGGRPYNKLPAEREAKVWRRPSGDVHVPAVTAPEWQVVVDTERLLLPQTWGQLDMLTRRYEMLRAIRQTEDPASPAAGFNLLPLCRSGRVFLKLDKDSLRELCGRAGVAVAKDDVLSIFDSRKLNKLMRRPRTRSDETVELQLAGEFFRTDGVQAQFVCGVKRGAKRKADGKEAEDGEDAADPASGTADVDDEDLSDVGLVPESVENLFACDPGKVNLFNIGKARLVAEEAAPPGLQPLGDGQYVVWDEVYRMSKSEFDERRGTTKRRKQRAEAVASDPAYRAALGVVTRNSLSCVDAAVLGARLILHFRSHKAIHAFEGSRAVARTRFEAYMGKQRIYGHIASKFKRLLGKEGVCAWGGARWAHAAKGRAPCPAGAVYRHLIGQPWARGRFPREAETNTSCKCSNCLSQQKMVHPHHARVYQSRWVWMEGRREKVKVGLLGGGRINGLYQCTAGGCYKTWSRDRNAPANIGRCYWERSHGRGRPETLRSAYYNEKEEVR